MFTRGLTNSWTKSGFQVFSYPPPYESPRKVTKFEPHFCPINEKNGANWWWTEQSVQNILPFLAILLTLRTKNAYDRLEKKSHLTTTKTSSYFCQHVIYVPQKYFGKLERIIRGTKGPKCHQIVHIYTVYM